MSPNYINTDTAWKDILDAYFPDFVAYCLPKLNVLIDWKQAWESLDKELHAITKENLVGTRLLDKLFKVFLTNGHEQWILVHIEIQGTYDAKLSKRMFTYAYRIFDKYEKTIVSCAILTDAKKNWRPRGYKTGLAGSVLGHDFLVVKLIDYSECYKELESSANPFASVILCQLEALKSKRKPSAERYNIKYNLTRRLYDKGFNKRQIKDLYLFIDWLINLPAPLEIEYKNQLHQLEESKKMAYISTIERMGIAQGIVQGRQEGEAALLARQLTRRFGALPLSYRTLIEKADADVLLEWGDRVLFANSLEEVFQS